MTTASPTLELGLAVPAAPTPLALPAERRAFAVPAALHGALTEEPRRLTLQQVDLELLGDAAGVAVFAPRTGARLTWHPLQTAERLDNGDLQLTIRPPATRFVITVAPTEKGALHGYFTMATLDATSTTALTVAVPCRTVVLICPDQRTAGPFQLTRVGEPDWHAQIATAGGIWLDGGRVELPLGVGDYEVRDPISKTLHQRFTVAPMDLAVPPTSVAVTLTTDLARPRGRRQ